MTAPIPKRRQFEDMARQLAARHLAWDVPHHFYALHYDPDAQQMSVGDDRLIGLDTDPDTMPAEMVRLAFAHIKSTDDPAAICGWALGWEGHTVFGLESMTDDERAQYDRDTRARRLYTRPDAVECFQITLADLRGRAWLHTLRVGEDPADAAVAFFGSPVVPGQGRLSGQFARALRSIGCATGHVLHGLPVPGGLQLPDVARRSQGARRFGEGFGGAVPGFGLN